MFLKIIACEVLFREVCACAAGARHQLDLEFLSQGYHDNPLVGIRRIQERIDAQEEGRYDAVLIGYGLCNNMLAGLQARDAPLVLPRAHDCITFFLGSKERYTEHFQARPGTYYYTSGWLEHRQRGGERPERRQGAGLGQQMEYEALVAKYGEDNARFLLETLDNWTQHYSRGAFIDFPFSAHLPHKQTVRDLCSQRGWEYEEIAGDLGLLQTWLDGPWSEEEFLVVPPGQRIEPSYDAQIIQIEMPGESAP